MKWQYSNGTKYRIIKKEDSKLMRSIGFILKPFNKDFMTRYTTTIGHTIYSPTGKVDPILLAHELVHVRQWQKWGLWFSFSYLFVLPFGITMRGYWERQAYEVTIRMEYSKIKKRQYDYLSFESNIRHLKKRILSQFTSSNYLYMDLRKEYLSKWFDNIIKDIEK